MFRRFRNHDDDCPNGPCTACKANRARWRLKQLLPLTYRTTYGTEDGAQHFAVWRMWFGRVFAHDEVTIAS